MASDNNYKIRRSIRDSPSTVNDDLKCCIISLIHWKTRPSRNSAIPAKNNQRLNQSCAKKEPRYCANSCLRQQTVWPRSFQETSAHAGKSGLSRLKHFKMKHSPALKVILTQNLFQRRNNPDLRLGRKDIARNGQFRGQALYIERLASSLQEPAQGEFRKVVHRDNQWSF